MSEEVGLETIHQGEDKILLGYAEAINNGRLQPLSPISEGKLVYYDPERDNYIYRFTKDTKTVRTGLNHLPDDFARSPKNRAEFAALGQIYYLYGMGRYEEMNEVNFIEYEEDYFVRLPNLGDICEDDKKDLFSLVSRYREDLISELTKIVEFLYGGNSEENCWMVTNDLDWHNIVYRIRNGRLELNIIDFDLIVPSRSYTYEGFPVEPFHEIFTVIQADLDELPQALLNLPDFDRETYEDDVNWEREIMKGFREN